MFIKFVFPDISNIKKKSNINMNITKEGAAIVPGLCCIFSRATGRCGWH